MAKLTTSPIGSFTQAAITTINDNMDAIEAAVENTLSRDGTSPNQMGADIDLNGNDLLNVNTLDADAIVLAGEVLIPTDINAGTAQAILDAIKTVDGAGSGLDADLLDGQHGAYYLARANHTGTQASTTVTYTPTWTSAISRSLQTRLMEQMSVKDFGAVGDGVTNDTAAIALAETARAAVGGELVFPPGLYLFSGQAINRANGGGWRGIGQCKLIPTANSTIMIDITGAVVGATSPVGFYVHGFTFGPNGKTGVVAIRETAPYYSSFKSLKFLDGLAYCCILTGSSAATQTGWVNIDDIHQRGSGTWVFQGFDDTHYIFNINVTNFNQQGTGGSTWTDLKLFKLHRAVSVYLNNVNAASLDGGADGVSLDGDCQGVFLSNVIIGWPRTGVKSVVGTDTLIPSYVYLVNCGFDQPTVAGLDIAGRTWRIHNTNSTNGYLRGSTDAALRLRATATDIFVRDFLAAYMNHDGIKVDVGATKVILAGVTAENNNQNAGGNFDVNLTSCSFTDVILEGRNYIGTAGVNATGQRIVNGTTSKEVSRNTGSASTTAVTTQEDLMTYSIPANTLKAGQKVRLTAWGTTAANANTKTVRLWFGANSVVDHSGTWNTTPWKITADIFVLTTGGAATQEYNGVAWPTALVQTVRQGTASNADNVAVTVKVTGQNGTASAADIVCQGFTVEIID